MRDEGKDGLPSPFGRYALVERLATGGMAEVFKAKISSTHGFEKLLVIKRILPNLAADKNFVSMFIDEAKLTAQLIHPKIVQVIDFGDVDGQLFIALEYIDGFDALALLRAAAHKQVRLPIPITLFITMELLDALDYAHNAKDVEGKPMRLVHRDISPSNVFIARRGDVKLGDFGIAHAQKRESKTQVGTLKGKYGYMSPEQVVGGAIDARSDLFAVGVVLAELLTGRRLFTAPNDLDVLLMVRDGKLDRWNKYGRDVPPAIDALVRKALERRVHERFQTAAEFREALSDLLFQSRFRISPQDLGRVAADYFDKSPEATTRLRDQAGKWEMRLPVEGPNAITSEIALAAPPSQTQTPPRLATPLVPSEELLDVVIDDGSYEVPDADSSIELTPISSAADSARVPSGATPSGSSGSSASLRPPSVGASGSGPRLSSAPSPPPGLTGRGRGAAPAAQPSAIDLGMIAALDSLLAGAQPLAVVGLDQYEAPTTGVSPPPPGLATSGTFAISPGSGVARPPSATPDTAGDLLAFGPMRVLAELAFARETGLLRLLLATHVKDVYIVQGAPESVTGSARTERFGEYLVARGILRAVDLERVAAQSARFGGRTAPALAGLGLLGPPEVARLRAQHVREKIIEIAATTQGRFEFYRGEITAAEGAALGLDVLEMLGAGVLALAPEHLERRFVPELDCRPVAVQPARVSPDAFRLGRSPRELLSRLDGRRTVRDWIAVITSQEDLLTFFRTMHLLLETGLAAYA